MSSKPTIALACDHAGFALKEEIKQYLQGEDYALTDFGTRSEQAVDFPDFIYPAARAVAQGECERGIFLDGAGYPSAMLANKLYGVYAAVCNDLFSARLSREHSNSNVLCLGGKVIGSAVALEIVKLWLTTEFAGGRYQQRLEKLHNIEQTHLKSPEFTPRKVITPQDLKDALLKKEPLIITQETIISPGALELAHRIL